MYSGHIIIQGCQLWPFEGNKYLQLHTFQGLNFVWTHSCNECHSPSFIHLASLRSRHFIQIKTTEREKSCCHWCGPNPGLFGGVLHSLQGGVKIISLRKDDGWQVKFVSRDWRWMVTEVFILRMEVGVRRGWVPKGTRRWQIYPLDPLRLGLFFVLNPHHWLSDPHCSCCRCVKNTTACQASRLHSRAFVILLWLIFWPCLFGLLQQLLDSGSVG